MREFLKELLQKSPKTFLAKFLKNPKEDFCRNHRRSSLRITMRVITGTHRGILENIHGWFSKHMSECLSGGITQRICDGIHGKFWKKPIEDISKKFLDKYIEEFHKEYPKESPGIFLKKSRKFLKETLKEFLKEAVEYSLEKFMQQFLEKFRALDFLKKCEDDFLNGFRTVFERIYGGSSKQTHRCFLSEILGSELLEEILEELPGYTCSPLKRPESRLKCFNASKSTPATPRDPRKGF